jgi:hypothetical protein
MRLGKWENEHWYGARLKVVNCQVGCQVQELDFAEEKETQSQDESLQGMERSRWYG